MKTKKQIWSEILAGAHEDIDISKSDEEKVTNYLNTPEGSALHDQYRAADEEIAVPVEKREEKPRTLREYGDQALDAIAKKVADKHGLSFEGGHSKAASENAAYAEIYSLTRHSARDIADIDFSANVSKSKTDAIRYIKNHIDIAAARGV